MVFSYAILIGISLIYYSTGQTDISKAFMIINIYNTDPSLSIPFIFIILGIIGKFGSGKPYTPAINENFSNLVTNSRISKQMIEVLK